MVQGIIIIPADNSAPLRASRLHSLEDHLRAVGGWIEAVDIPDLGVTMYVNEEGLIRDLLSTAAPHSCGDSTFHKPATPATSAMSQSSDLPTMRTRTASYRRSSRAG
ncbi:hypothetical protein AB0O90_04720 [Microbacterium testaceum]|uniref:DUF3846 domain-containing protein n=1 Tax=Microbacterium testaceum TaxID=2033 RepID=UPI003449812D